MTTAHTPGPWFYRCGDEWSHSVVTHHGELPDGKPSYWTVASINKQREPEHEANARLVAAAPELLAALLEAVECGLVPISSAAEGGATRHSKQVHVADQIRAAIAKATGAA